jgi:hypothetical protein
MPAVRSLDTTMKEAAMPTDTMATSPLKFPAPPDAATARAIRERLRGHTTATDWLLAGVFDWLDDLRDEHLRLRGQVAEDLEALNQLTAKFRREDAEHQEALRQAYRDGGATPEDRRMPTDEREAQHAARLERVFAGAHVLADHADHVIETIREREDETLAELESRLEPALAKRREAARLLAEADAQAYQLHMQGRWVQNTADDGAFGRQVAPANAAMPARLHKDVLKHSFKRHFSKLRPWNRGYRATNEMKAWNGTTGVVA